MIITTSELYKMLFAKKLEEPKSIGSWTCIGSRYEKPNNEINGNRYWKYVLVSILPTTIDHLRF